jgi:hypothetical protein
MVSARKNGNNPKNTSKEMSYFDKLTVYCDCESPEHQFTFVKDKEEGEVWLQIHLTHHEGFLRRLWVGLKYAFGYTSKYGEWDNTIVTQEDQLKIIEFLKDKSQ